MPVASSAGTLCRAPHVPQRQVVGRRREVGEGKRAVLWSPWAWGRWARRVERGGGGIEAGGKRRGVVVAVVVVVGLLVWALVLAVVREGGG